MFRKKNSYLAEGTEKKTENTGFFERKAQKIKAWGQERADFTSSTWKLFKFFITDTKSRQVIRKEIPFEEALDNWGISNSELRILQAQRISFFFVFFFFIMFVWCAWYFMRSMIVAQNFYAGLSSLVGLIASFIVCVVSFWRWQVLKKRKYMPFFSWLYRGRLAILFCFGLLCLSQPSLAQTGGEPAINLPENVEIQKDSDVTAAMFSRLLGASWTEIAGDKSNAESTGTSQTHKKLVLDGYGIYSGLIVNVLYILNLASMVFVAASIIYMWGIFAVTTAHEGKKLGGSMFNSLWVPVRHALSFSLVVPVLNGLSLLQVAIIACIALSINFANVVWDYSGKYIKEHAHTGLIDTASPMMETEAYKMIGPMFETSVLFEIEKNRGKKFDPKFVSHDAPRRVQGNTDFGTCEDIIIVNDQGNPDPNGEYVFLIDNLNGKIDVRMRPTESIKFKDMGGFFLDYPKLKKISYGKDDDDNDSYTLYQEPQNGSQATGGIMGSNNAGTVYQLQKKVALERAKALLGLWTSIRKNAKAYMSSTKSGNDGCVFPVNGGKCYAIEDAPNNPDVVSSIKTYLTKFNAASKHLVDESIKENDNLRKSLLGAIDSDIDHGSKYGWASAGLFTFSLASLQKKLDSQILMPGSATNLNQEAKDNTTGWLGLKIFQEKYTKTLNENEQSAILNAPSYVDNELFSNTRYSARERALRSSSTNEITGFLHQLITAITSIFFTASSGTDSKNGLILGMVLDEFGSYDPIIVIQHFGDKLLDICWYIITMSGILRFTIGDFFGIGAGLALLFIGCVFAYVVPITPVIFWLRALLSWIFMVIEAMVAAPFWACTHALPEGAGFAGQHAKRGYMMLLDIVIRPTLLVVGAVTAIAIIQASGWLFNILFQSWYCRNFFEHRHFC